jgi:penicillin V acylase-like amidase (Ntn superfamily)
MNIGSGWSLVARTTIAALAIGTAARYAEACTRIFSNDTGGSALVARSMDWATTTEPVLMVLPRGRQHDGGRSGC